MSALMQLALLSGAALCLALLLQRVNNNNNNNHRENRHEGVAGHFPPMLHRKAAPEPARGSGGHFSRAHNPEAIARAKGSTAAGGKSNLAGQIIPVYGFGILLYILYIIFKITSKGKTNKSHETRFSAVRSENRKRKITDFELTQLQERLKETEEVMEKIVSRAQVQNGSSDREGPVSMDQEEALLLQLREITRVMQEGQLVDRFPPEQEPSDPHYDQDLDDYSDGTVHPEWHQHCCKHLQSCRFQHGEMDREDGWESGGDGGGRPASHDFDGVHDEEDIAGDWDEDEEQAGKKSLEAFSAAETFHRLSPGNEDPGWNAVHPGITLIRRKTSNEAVRVT